MTLTDVSEIHHIDQFEEVASGVLSDSVVGYVAGGAGRETSVVRNRQALDALLLVPRVLRDVAEVSTSTTILGQTSRHPLILAPSAVQGMAHPHGELATARAASAADVTMILAMNSSTPMEEVSGTGVRFWMQLYMSPDRGHMRQIVERAATAGAGALCITVDHAGMPARLRELRRPLQIPPDITLVHLPPTPSPRPIDRKMTWEVLDWLRGISDLPVVLKGILHPDDALLAAELGVEAIVVSNHGGRQLDGVASAYDVLKHIAEVVEDRLEVYADGGIRSGPDLLKVLALGAKAGMVGRPVWWSLAAAGEAGVARMIDLVTTDLEEAMRMCGQRDVTAIEGDILLR